PPGIPSGTALKAELLHASLEGRSLEAQDLGGAAVAADPPAGPFQHGGDVLALDLLEAQRRLLRAPFGRRSDEIAQCEAAARRQDDRPLDDVLQLAHVSRPGVAGQLL